MAIFFLYTGTESSELAINQSINNSENFKFKRLYREGKR